MGSIKETLEKYLAEVGRTANSDDALDLVLGELLADPHTNQAMLAIQECLSEDPLMTVGKTIEAVIQSIEALQDTNVPPRELINTLIYCLISMHYAIIRLMADRDV